MDVYEDIYIHTKLAFLLASPGSAGLRKPENETIGLFLSFLECVM